MRIQRLLFLLKPYWRSIVLIVSPLIFLPLLIISGTQEAKCGYVVLLMSVYWVTEVVPLAVTALIPVMLFPLLGVMSTDDVCVQYLKETAMLVLTGLIASTAIEYCDLHKRIALKVLLTVGTSPRLLMLGFMLNTMFLSMWVSNTATATMMVPIVRSVLTELRENDKQLILGSKISNLNDEDDNSRRSSHSSEITSNENLEELSLEQKEKLSILKKNYENDKLRYYLGVAYACNIGGSGTITGSAKNLFCLEIFYSVFPDGEGLTIATWLAFNVPVLVINTFVAWIWLQIMYLKLFNCRSKSQKATQRTNNSDTVRKILEIKYEELGKMNWHQYNVLVLFIILIFLWFFRKPEFIPGWSSLYPDTKVLDSTPAVLIILLFFILPANLDFLTFNDLKGRKTSPSLLHWKIVQEKVPWGVVLLLGGGYAMAEATQVSGLSDWIGQQLIIFKTIPPEATITIVCLFASLLTEVCSNSAVANILVPVLAEMSKVIRVHPIYLMMPATVCCSYSFMLPMATPPNAIVSAASKIKTTDMLYNGSSMSMQMKAGFVLNFLTVAVLLAMLNTYGYVIYDFGEFPSWAEPSNDTQIYWMQ